MKSEIIFKELSSCRGRYGDTNETTITIGASFESPAEWPYTLKEVCTNEDGWGGKPEVTRSECYKLSKDLYAKIKAVISDAKSALDACEEELENGSMDGCVEAFTFTVDGLDKFIHGDEILSSGSYEAEKYAPDMRGDSYVVYSVVEKIKNLLAGAGIEIYF